MSVAIRRAVFDSVPDLIAEDQGVPSPPTPTPNRLLGPEVGAMVTRRAR